MDAFKPVALTTNPITSNVLCKNESNGSIILNTTGGTNPYNEDFGGNNPLQLSSGSYSYTVTDANGCIISDTFSISEPDSLLSSITYTNATCAGYFDGTATLYISGGTIPYNTDWNGSNPNGLNAGIHNYIITDDNGCSSFGQPEDTALLTLNPLADVTISPTTGLEICDKEIAYIDFNFTSMVHITK